MHPKFLDDNQLFIIMDFNATRKNSHHWTYLEAYKRVIDRNKIDFEIWVPVNTDNEIIKNLGSRVRPILKSISYGFERNQNAKSWVFNKILMFLIVRLDKFCNSKFTEIIKSHLCKLYFLEALNEIKKYTTGNLNVSVALTTADSLALRFVNLCLQKGIKLHSIAIRSIGVAFKDPLKINSAEIFYKKLIETYPKCDIKIGYETEVYKNILLKSGVQSNKIFWAPVPSRKRIRVISPVSRLSLGFLGTARPNKGFDDIPNLIDALIDNKIEFIAKIQKAVFPWPDYFETLEKLYEFKDNVTIISENISQKTLEKLLATTDILILPYNTNDYRIAGSGLLFMAADYKIPTLAKKGVAFEWDINNYRLGKTYSTINDFVHQIQIISQHKIEFGFEEYNADRNRAILNFLNLEI